MVSFRSYGSTVAMFFIPQARPKSSTDAATVGSPMSVRPVPGCSWWPVMAVVRLSTTMITAAPLL